MKENMNADRVKVSAGEFRDYQSIMRDIERALARRPIVYGPQDEVARRSKSFTESITTILNSREQPAQPLPFKKPVRSKQQSKKQNNDSWRSVALYGGLAMLLLLGLFWIQPSLTGFLVGGDELLSYENELNLTFNEKTQFTWSIPKYPKHFELENFAITGSYEENSSVKVYLQAGSQKYLLLDTEVTNSLELITGRVVDDNESDQEEEESEDAEDEESDEEESPDNQTSEPSEEINTTTPSNNETLNLTSTNITTPDEQQINLTSNTTSNVSIIINETINVTINSTSNSSTNLTLNQTINTTINATLNQTINGSLNLTLNASLNQTLNFTGNLSLNDSINSTTNLTINASTNISLNSSLDTDENSTSENNETNITIILPTRSFFTNYCGDNCDLPQGISFLNYTIIVEVNGTVHIDEVSYAVLDTTPEVNLYIEVKDSSEKFVDSSIELSGNSSYGLDNGAEAQIESGEYELLITPEEHIIQSLLIENRTFTEDKGLFIALDENLPIQNATQSYAISTSEALNATIQAKASKLFECSEWNSTDQRCIGQFSETNDLIVNSSYTLHVDSGNYAWIESNTNLTNLTYTKVKEDPRYDAIIDSANLDNGTLRIIFHHDSPEPLPIEVIGRLAHYKLDKNVSAYEENVTLTIYNYTKKQFFRVRVGAQSEVFEFGEPAQITFDAQIGDAKNQSVNYTLELVDALTDETVVDELGGEKVVDEGLYDIIVKPLENPIQEIAFEEVEIFDNITDFINIEDVDEQEANLSKYIEVYAIDPTPFNFTNATVTVTATGTDLYKCKDWNFSTQSCYGNWTLFKTGLVPGQTYNFTLTPEDPGFGEIINITQADHLDENRTFISDIFEQVRALDGNWSETIPDQHYVRVVFEKNLTSENDITVYPRTVSGTPRIEIYEENGTELIAEFTSLTDNEYNKVYLTGLEGIQDTFDLRIVGGSVEFDYIVDPTIINYTGWESGWQGWTDGGTDAIRSSTRSQCQDNGASGGSWSMNIQDNSATSYIENTFDFSAYDRVNVEFSGYFTSLESGECLELRCDGSTMWTRGEAGGGCADITEDSWHDNLNVNLTNDNCTFDSSVAIRFEAEFSGDGDDVWIDCINITGYDTTAPGGVNNLANQSATNDSIYWNWTNPTATDFNVSIIYVNETNVANTSNNFYNATGLNVGANYTITLNTMDDEGNINTTNVTSTAQTVNDADSVSPSYSNLADNSTSTTPWKNVNVTINVTFTDNSALGYYIFSWNDNSSWVNDSSASMSGTEYNVSLSKQVTANKSTNVTYRFYFNDTGGNSNQTVNGSFIVRDAAPTTPSLDLLTNKTNISDTTPFFNWTASTDADSETITYGIEISNESDMDPILQQNMTLPGTNYTATTLGADTYYWRVKAITTDANSSYAGVRVFTLDLSPPAIITNLGNQSQNGGSIYWNWTNPSDVDFNYSVVYVNGTWQANTSNNYYNATGLKALTNYTITVNTVDTAGNVNTTNVTHNASTSPDTDNPSVTAIIPSSGSLKGISQSTEIAANVSDVSVDKIKANITYPNGTVELLNLSLANSTKYNATFSVPDLSGRYNVTILANDSSSNKNHTETTWFNASNYGTLNITFIGPSDPTNVAQYATFTINASVTCDGAANATCGLISALARHNGSSANADTNISRHNKTQPFFVKEIKVNLTNHTVSTSDDQPWHVHPVDLDQDGDIDLIVTEKSGDRITWYDNDGNQTFTRKTAVSSLDQPYKVYAGDLDSDGDIDLVSGSEVNDTVNWYENDGSESFTGYVVSHIEGVGAPMIIDLDLDSDQDIVLSAGSNHSVLWFENNGSQNFTRHVIANNSDSLQSTSYSIGAVDVDNDTDIDVLSISATNDRINLYRNNGSQSFLRASVWAGRADGVRAAHFADMDGDGDHDILAASPNDDEIQWFTNHEGFFSTGPKVIGNHSGGAWDARAGDMDGDGDVDVIAVAAWNDTITWFENNGSGIVWIEHNFSVGQIDSPYITEIADVDNDGDLDVVTAGNSDNEVTWFENRIDFNPKSMLINLTQGQTWEVGWTINATRAGEHEVDVLFNSSFGTSAISDQHTSDATVNTSDLTGPNVTFLVPTGGTKKAVNTTVEIAANVSDPNGVSVVLINVTLPNGSIESYTLTNADGNKYNVSFSNTPLLGRYNITFIANDSLGTLNKTETSWFNSTNLGSLNGTWYTPANNSVVNKSSIFLLKASVECAGPAGAQCGNVSAFARYNGSTILPDTFMSNTTGATPFSVHGGEANIQERVNLTSRAGDVPKHLFPADFDGDGDMDFIANGAAANLSWFENNGSENFTRHFIDPIGTLVNELHAVDLDGDGDMDPLVSQGLIGSGTLKWFENNGSGNFTQHNLTNVGEWWTIYGIDMDIDGDMDILAGEYGFVGGNEVSWFENNGSQNFTKHSVGKGSFPQDAYPIDVDRDGDLDVVAAFTGAGTLSWFENNGSQNFTHHNISTNNDGIKTVDAADLDGDGDIDIVAQSGETDDRIAWYENNGSQTFTEHNLSSPANPTYVDATDIDSDLDMDFLVTFDNGVTVYENNGSGNFTRYNLTKSFFSNQMAYGVDLDSDSDVDILGTITSGPRIYWHENVLEKIPRKTDSTLESGEKWNVTFPINATGATAYMIDVFFNSSMSNSSVEDNHTLDIKINITTSPDNVTPGIDFVGPTPSTGNVSGSAIQANVTASDDNGIAFIKLFLHNSTGGLLQTNSTATSPHFINYTGLSDATYILNATVNDTSGNLNKTETRTITVDSVIPAAITNLQAHSIGNSSIYWNWTNPTGAGFNYSQVFLDGVWQANTSNAFYNATGLTMDTSHTITIQTVDEAGNVNTTNSTMTNTTIITWSDITSCTTLSGTNKFYRLTQNVSGSGTCMAITASNITLNCDGYKITYKTGGSDSRRGIEVDNTDNANVRVKNCVIRAGSTSGSGGMGIFFDNSTSNGLAFNNTIFTNGTTLNYGILFQVSNNGTVDRNSIHADGSSSSNLGVYSYFSNNTKITNNTITTDGTDGNDGAVAYIVSDVEIINNTITTDGSANGNRGVLLSDVDSGIIESNTITAYGTKNNDGIQLYNTSNSTVKHNTVIANGSTEQNRGILSEGPDNIIANNTVTTDAVTAGGSIGSIGILLTDRKLNANNLPNFGNIVDNNTINTNGVGKNYGFMVWDANHSFVRNNIIATKDGTPGAGNSSHGLFVRGISSNVTFENNILNSPVDWINVSLTANVTFTNTTYNTSFGSIRIPGAISRENVATNVTQAHLNITNNSAFLNSTALDFLNTSGQITLYNITFSNPEPYVDYNDDGTFEGCGGNCTEISYNASSLNNYIFNVTHFTTFKGDDDTKKPGVEFVTPTTNTSNASQNYIEANVTASDEIGLSTINVTLYNSTGGLLQSNTSTSSPYFINYTGLSDATYYLNATANDTSGNLNKTETRTIGLDVTNPATITNLANQSQTTRSIYWNWTNPSDSDFSENIIYINESNVANTSNNFYNGSGLNPNANYTITINTKDNFGNINTTNVTSTVSTQDPQIVINSISHTPDPQVIGQLLTITANVTDDVDVSLAWVEINYTNYSMTQSGDIWTYSYNTSGLANATYNYTVYANDTETNNATPKNDSFTLSGSEITSCQTISASGRYQLTTNLSATGDCMVISAADVNFDCGRHKITYDTSGSGSAEAIFVDSSSPNALIENCIVEDSTAAGSASYSVYLSGSNNSRVTNNSITGRGTSSISLYVNAGHNYTITTNNVTMISGGNTVYGIYIIDSDNGSVYRNFVNSTGAGSQHRGVFYRRGWWGNISHNRIISESTDLGSNYGVWIYTSNHSITHNNTINTDGTTSNFGIIFYSAAYNNNGTNNTIVVNGSGGSNYGIIVYPTSSKNTTVSGNNIKTNGTTGNAGINTGANTSFLIDNVIVADGSSDRNYGIYLQKTSYNVIENNTITSQADGQSHGLRCSVLPGLGNVFRGNNVTTIDKGSNNDGYGIYVTEDGMCSFYNNTLSSPNAWIGSNETTNNFSTANTTFETNSGRIGFPGVMYVAGVTYLNYSSLNITSNKAFVNSTLTPLLNRSAQVKLTGLAIKDIYIERDHDDDGTYEQCKTPNCTETSYSGGEFTFNVTTWSSYRGGNDSKAPGWSNLADNSTVRTPVVNESITINVTLTDDTNLSTFTFSWNDTGTWVNDSPIKINGTSITVNVSKQVTASTTTNVGYRIFFNDTSDNTNQTDISSFIVGTKCGDVSSSTTLANNVSATGTCFTITADDVTLDCAGNTITYNTDGGADEYGILAEQRDGITITGCTIIDGDAGGQRTHSVFLNYSGNSIIENSTISVNGTNANAVELWHASNISVKETSITAEGNISYGIYLKNISNSNVSRNSITTISNGGAWEGNSGIFADDLYNTTLAHNDVRLSGNATGGIGISIGWGYLGSAFTSYGNNITNNTFNDTSNNPMASISLDTMSDSNTPNIIRDNRFIASSADDMAFLSTINGTVFINNLFDSGGNWMEASSPNRDNNFTNTTFRNGNGSIRFDGLFILNDTADVTITTTKLNITNNLAYLNSTNLTFLNTTGQVTLNTIIFEDPSPQIDLEDDGSFAACGAVCTEVSYNTSGLNTYIFNVTHFTTYRAFGGNSLPGLPILVTPVNSSSITNRTPQFLWNNSVDADNDNLTYNIQVDNDSSFASPEINITGINETTSNTSHIPSSNLEVDTMYYWRVRANDSTGYGNYSLTFNFTVDSYAAISLTSSAVAFGSLAPSANDNTTDNSPAPLLLENQGNIFVNITLTGTPMFTQADFPSTNFRFKIDANETGAFNTSLSTTTFTNITNVSSTVDINQLGWSDAADTAEADILVSVPDDEAPGDKTANITFTVT